jgi:hypothetical protein
MIAYSRIRSKTGLIIKSEIHRLQHIYSQSVIRTGDFVKIKRYTGEVCTSSYPYIYFRSVVGNHRLFSVSTLL